MVVAAAIEMINIRLNINIIALISLFIFISVATT